MIRRLYVNNFRALVNFELQPGPMQLLLGTNGAGKTSVFDVLWILREFVIEQKWVAELFPKHSLTRWLTVPEQHFELEFEVVGGTFKYALVISHDLDRGISSVASESLTLSGNQLFKVVRGQAQLYRDDYSEGPPIRINPEKSGIGWLAEHPDNAKVTAFKARLRDMLCVRVDPTRMSEIADGEVTNPRRDMGDFSQWYRHVQAESQTVSASYRDDLREVLPQFDGLGLVSVSPDVKRLIATFDREIQSQEEVSHRTVSFGFDELSDGQRALVALYALLHYSIKFGVIVCLDEPENYVALSEIQPWLFAVREAVEEEGGQVLLISHHPILLDHLAPECGLRFSRDEGLHVRVKPFAASIQPDMPLTASELVARGWDDA